jgi:tripartite-type tricarboxylate transporter receptor subunit TctC
MTGTTMTHVPYKGAGPAAVALLGGEVTFTFGSGPSILGQVDAGKVIVLGVSSIDRVPNRQNFPTLNELGFKGYESNSLGGVVGPAGLPPAVSAKISQTIQRIVNSKDMQDKILAAGMVPLPGTGKDFEVMITKDRIRYGALIKEMDIK